jgi:hypothetical protein
VELEEVDRESFFSKDSLGVESESALESMTTTGTGDIDTGAEGSEGIDDGIGVFCSVALAGMFFFFRVSSSSCASGVS